MEFSCGTNSMQQLFPSNDSWKEKKVRKYKLHKVCCVSNPPSLSHPPECLQSSKTFNKNRQKEYNQILNPNSAPGFDNVGK